MNARWPVLSYFGIAYAISWVLWLPRIATEQGWWDWFVPEWWHYAGAAGPVVAALVVTARTEGQPGLCCLLRQFRLRRTARSWFIFAVASPVLLFLLSAVVARMAGETWPVYSGIAKTGNLPALGLPVTFLVHVATFGIGEETGWRGFALPRLQARHNALRATLLLAAGWGIWHVPSFFGNPGYADLGPVELVGWAIGLVLGAVFLTWLYNSTSGSLVPIVLWHGLFNTLVASEAAQGLIAAVMTTGIMVLAVFALLVAGSRHLRGFSRSAGPRQQHESPHQEAAAVGAPMCGRSVTANRVERTRRLPGDDLMSELVVGAVTQPWQANVVFRALASDEYAAFQEPGYVKIVWTLRADPISASESVFLTETRVQSTDAEARRRFRWYWSFFSPGMMLIRWISLGPVKAEAERRARDAERTERERLLS